MAESELRNRIPLKSEASSTDQEVHGHPSGKSPYGWLGTSLRMLLFVLYFFVCAIAIHGGQLMVTPLYFYNKDYYYAYMAFSKQQFGLVINTITQWFCPTVIRISADEAVADEMRLTEDSRLECSFPNRMVMMANHQIYTDWLYLWWISYANRMHGHLFIILKESLKYIPLIGPGMMLYGFVFMARSWLKDKPRLQHRLHKLKSRHSGPMSGPESLDPMWLLIFPEGTNLSKNGRASSAKWAQRSGQPDMLHQLIPRTTGLQFCLAELRDTVEWVYDCTIAYEGIPRGEYGQDVFTLTSIYFQGRPPKSVNMYWRRFRVSEIPIDEQKAFEKWVIDRWGEKDALLEGFMQTGRFPPNPPSANKELRRARGAFFETEVKQKYPLEYLLVFLQVPFVVGAILLLKHLASVLGFG